MIPSHHKKALLVAAALLLALPARSALAQDCAAFQTAVGSVITAFDTLRAQTRRYEGASDVPQYDAGVCSSARDLKDRANSALLANSGCDANTVDAVKQMRDSADNEIGLFCTRPQAAPTSSAPIASGGGFIFPDSDRRLLSPSEVSRLSASQLRIARNEIYARRGRYFQSDDLKQYFGGFSWYRPNSWNPDLNAVERQNVQVIQDAERRR